MVRKQKKPYSYDTYQIPGQSHVSVVAVWDLLLLERKGKSVAVVAVTAEAAARSQETSPPMHHSKRKRNKRRREEDIWVLDRERRCTTTYH